MGWSASLLLAIATVAQSSLQVPADACDHEGGLHRR